METKNTNNSLNGRKQEHVYNTSNSNMRVLDNSITLNSVPMISIRQFKKITGNTSHVTCRINKVKEKDKIRCNDPLVCTPGCGNSFIWFVTREGALALIEHSRSTSFKNGKEKAINNLNLFFAQEEANIKTPYKTLIDISFGPDNNNQMNFYADCSEGIIALKKLIENENVINHLMGEEKFSIDVSIDKTLSQRQKV